MSVAFSRVALLYALSATVTCLVVPYAARRVRSGMNKMIFLAVLAAASAYALLASTFQGSYGAYSLFVIILVSLLLGLYRALYWVPYEVERRTTRESRGRFSHELLIALVPVGIAYTLVVGHVPESWVLLGSVSLMLLSLVPFIWIPNTYERFSWGYRETFTQLFMPAHRRLLLGALLDGVQGTAFLLVWPIAIYLIVEGSYTTFGLIISLSLLSIILIRGAVEVVERRIGVLNSTPVRIVIVSTAWIGRLFVAHPLTIVLVSAYERIGNPTGGTIDHLTHEQSADLGHFVDEYTTLREIGLSLGKMLLAMLVAICAVSYSIYVAFAVTFIFVAVTSSVSMMLHQHPRS
jgi:hypothetical protein